MSVRAPMKPPPGGYPPGPGRPSPSSGGGGRGPWPVVLLVAGLVAAIALVAGGILFTRDDFAEEQLPLGSPAMSTPSAPQVAPTTVDPQAATKAEVIAGYRAAFDEQLAVGRDPSATADDDRLRAHRTGDALGTIQLALVEFKSAGKVYIGDVKLSPKVVELSGDTATIQDCLEDATGAADAETGEVLEPATRVVTTVTVKMKKIGGTWKMANYRDEKTPCVPAAS